MNIRNVLPFIVYPILITCLFLLFPTYLPTAIIMFLVGFVLWNILEYCFHRYAFHNKKLPRWIKKYLSGGHVFHHRYPTKIENLIISITLTLPFSFLSLGVAFILFGTVNLPWFYTGLIFGLFQYEFMHFAAHHWRIPLAPFRYMKQYHLTHHHKQPNAKYMVSNPGLDFLIGTSC